ncbi:MAG: hypothetical protein Q8Q39_00215 [bacterium]|nr:hypothetical protein [bacterium]
MHHLIFEGAELTGKSSTIHGVWDFLEQKYNSGSGIMDGCVWFNADVGIFGTPDGPGLIGSYLNAIRKLAHKNIILEKFHLTDLVYSAGAHARAFARAERVLRDLDFKIILTEGADDAELFARRLCERIGSMQSYARVARSPQEYVRMQGVYRSYLRKSSLPHLVVDNTILPNENHARILKWLGEQ